MTQSYQKLTILVEKIVNILATNNVEGAEFLVVAYKEHDSTDLDRVVTVDYMEKAFQEMVEEMHLINMKKIYKIK